MSDGILSELFQPVTHDGSVGDNYLLFYNSGVYDAQQMVRSDETVDKLCRAWADRDGYKFYGEGLRRDVRFLLAVLIGDDEAADAVD